MNKNKKNGKFKNKSSNNGNGSNDDESINTDDDDPSDRSCCSNNSTSTEETNYDVNTPLVDGLIKIRNNYKTNGSSNHIAALIPDKNHFLQNYNSLTITKGINSDKTKYGNKNVKTHAEMDALKKTHNLIKRHKLKKGVKMIFIRN